jgi:predicted nuclease of predicted toxin-antitoxin system
MTLKPALLTPGTEWIIQLSPYDNLGGCAYLSGSPPKLIYLRCGNTTNQRLREIFGVHLQNALQQLSNGESVIEIE